MIDNISVSFSRFYCVKKDIKAKYSYNHTAFKMDGIFKVYEKLQSKLILFTKNDTKQMARYE